MIIKTDIEDFIDMHKKIYGEDKKINYDIYFDESNNIKQGVIGSDRDNNKDLENLYFVLGGIAIKKPLDFDALLKYIGARQIPVDAKFKFFSFRQNKFEDAIKQSRLMKLFEYFDNNDILIHFDVLHYMHYAMTDILDSLIEENDTNQDVALKFYPILQSDITEVLYKDFPRLHEMLCKYEFPNIPKDKANDFIRELLDVYTTNLEHYNMDAPENFTKELLRQIIKAKKEKNNLVFLEGNKPFVISDGVFENYLSRMVEFKDKKFFDNEDSIEKKMTELDTDYNKKLNVEFVDSKNSREIQICDAISGFVSRLYNFISHNNEISIRKFFSKLDDISFETLKHFFSLISKSDKVNPVMLKHTTPQFIERRFTLLYNLVVRYKKNIY